MAKDSNLSDAELKALAYFAVGVSSEGSIGGRDVSNKLSFAGSMKNGELHPVGNSGYSFGTLQIDLGQHPEMAPLLVSSFHSWAASNHPDWALARTQETQTINDLGRDGHTIEDEKGRPLDATVKAHLDAFMKSDDGVSFIHNHDVKQIDQLTRKADGHKDHGSAAAQLQETSLYKNATVDDQAKLATIMLKLENQSGHAYYPKIIKGINDGQLHNVDDVKKQVADILPRRKDGKPSYIEAGMDHALGGTDAFLKIRNADPQSELHKSWQNVIADPLVNPIKASIDPAKPTLGLDYNVIKDQFLHAGGMMREQKQIHQGHEFGTMHQGMHGEPVQKLQTQLGELGYLDNAVTPDGKFGTHTRDAVKVFQHDHHLPEVGQAGPATQRTMQADLQPLKQNDSGLLPSVSAMSTLPAAAPGLDDPRHALNPDNALYNKLKTTIPDASEQRLVQFTAACHEKNITDKNLNLVHFNQKDGLMAFASGGLTPSHVTVDVKQPSPPTAESIQQIQTHDGKQIQLNHQIQTQIQTQNAQAPQGPMPGGSPMPGGMGQ